jgi:hypothetical protein
LRKKVKKAVDDSNKRPVDMKKIKFKTNLLASGSQNNKWIVIITVISFILSASLMFFSTEILQNAGNLIAVLVVLVIIFMGIVFDMIGIAVTAADETPFHAMASRKFQAAKRAIRLIRNANKVSSFCNDVVGDICGIISGTASGLIVLRISGNSTVNETALAGIIISGFVASLTVGGKAVGKTYAISNSNLIVYRVSIIIHIMLDSKKNKKNSLNVEKSRSERRLGR